MPGTSLESLKESIKTYAEDAELDIIEKAYEYSRKAHEGQFRAAGEPFFEHPAAVARILVDLELDIVTLAASLLHDVVEDTGITLKDIEREFGTEVALLVGGVTKLERLEYRSRIEQQAENLRKMFFAMAKDIRVILIKLADRLHNMRTLSHLPDPKRQRIAEETLEIYAPLAHRLGISKIKWELEDLSLRYLQPETYRELAQKIPSKRKEREEFAEIVIENLKDQLQAVNIQCEIQGRAKHFYSIYRKMYIQGRDLSDIYDLIAIRVIVDSIKDCYGALGIVHSIWKPLPGRFKDYVATPKPNMYQSLHTTVIGPKGEPFEIQIRTWDMHRIAEYGIAAHWSYKEGGKTDPDFDKKLSWLREMLEWQYELKDAKEFMESLRVDLFSDEVFVFTPKGDVVNLPAGSNPIDFAYKIHTEVGHRMVGAKVNGKIAPIDSELKTGDIIEILTSKQSNGPSRDWLKQAQTSGAKNRIRQWFKKQNRDDNIERGKELVIAELKALNIDYKKALREDWIEDILKRLNFTSEDELFVSIGYGGLSAVQVAGRLRDLYKKEYPEKEAPEVQSLSGTPTKKTGDSVRVKGIDNVMVRFGRCCNPVPGDSIIGYITRGRGVSIHRVDCANVANHLEEKDRIIEVSWNEVEANYYPVDLEIFGLDRPGFLSDVAQVVAETKTNIITAKARPLKNGQAVIELVLELKNLEHLEFLRKKLLKIRDVVEVTRVSNQHSSSAS